MPRNTTSSMSAYFQELPVAAVVYGNLLAGHTQNHPWLRRFKQYSSYTVTAALLLVSVSGIYLAGSMVLAERSAVHGLPAGGTNPGKPPAAATSLHGTAYLPKSPPTEVEIPSISLAARTVAVGQNSDGTMEVPAPDVIGWYSLAPTPGELGPSVMTGHVDSAVSGPAVFWDLDKVQVGDEIRITRADGKKVVFKVEKTESYDQSDFPTASVYGNIDYAGLRLITCDGDFNYLTRHYSHNLVVYARAVL